MEIQAEVHNEQVKTKVKNKIDLELEEDKALANELKRPAKVESQLHSIEVF